MQLHIGTSGYSYLAWRGPFYPDGLPASDMLRFYGTRLPAVEINATFYAMPRPGVVAAWAGQVDPDFRFALKAPRAITHLRPLLAKESLVASLFKTAALLGDKLGAVLFQFPPSFHKDMELFAAFGDLLPGGVRVAFEFRHPSWFDDEIHEMLHRKEWALCWADGDDEKLSPFVPTADWGYLRLRKQRYTETALRAWARRITSQGWRLAFAFFKHEDTGAGPEMARRLLELCRAEEEKGAGGST